MTLVIGFTAVTDAVAFAFGAVHDIGMTQAEFPEAMYP